MDVLFVTAAAMAMDICESVLSLSSSSYAYALMITLSLSLYTILRPSNRLRTTYDSCETLSLSLSGHKI